MSQVAPGKSAEVIATSAHRLTCGTRDGLAGDGAVVATLGLHEHLCRPWSGQCRPELSIRGHCELKRSVLWQRECVQGAQVGRVDWIGWESRGDLGEAWKPLT